MKIIRTNPDVDLPSPATPGSAGFDLQAAIPYPVRLCAGDKLKISTGLKIHIDNPGIVALVFPRSGAGCKGLGIKNLTGVIDSDYQGEWFVTVWNTNPENSIEIQPLEKIAQAVFVPVIIPIFEEVAVFSSETVRGSGCLGSTDSMSNKPLNGGEVCGG